MYVTIYPKIYNRRACLHCRIRPAERYIIRIFICTLSRIDAAIYELVEMVAYARELTVSIAFHAHRVAPLQI